MRRRRMAAVQDGRTDERGTPARPSLLIGMGARLFLDGDRILVERQTASGLHGWARGFAPITGFAIGREGRPETGYVDAAAPGVLPPGARLVPLPDGYDRATLRRTRGAVGAQLLEMMRGADACVFSFGGWFGDWGMEAARLAARAGIPHAVWLDRIESQVVRAAPASGAAARAKRAAKSLLIARNERRAVRAADLALLHGTTVHEGLRAQSRNPAKSEDIHLRAADRAGDEVRRAKLETCRTGPLRIVYAGRAMAMKGPHDWLDVLGRLRREGVDFEARWLGDGPDLAAMRARVAAEGLDGVVTLEGFVDDRARVLAALREGHVLLFCHVTDESPRILLEALHSALPIVGYDDPFAAALVAEAGAGRLVARGEVAALAAEAGRLAADRDALADLIARAGRSAAALTWEAVFDERCRLVTEALMPKGAS